jgi:hypothetical protein
MAAGKVRRILPSIGILAVSISVAGALTVAVAISLAGFQDTINELSIVATRLETASWPTLARIVGPLSRGASKSEREIWLTLIELHGLGPSNRLIAIGVDPVALWPIHEREPASEVRARVVDGWAPGNPGTPEASAAVAHFIVQNERSATINCHDLPEHVRCIARSALERHEHEIDGWSAFSQENRGVREYLTLSRVGFNAAHSVAVVYAESSCGGLCGGGGYFVLRRQNKLWLVIAYHQKWVS